MSGIVGFYVGQREAATAAATASGRTNSGNGIAAAAASNAKVKRRSGHEDAVHRLMCASVLDS